MLKVDAILPYLEYEKFYIMVFPRGESSFNLQVVSKEAEQKLIYQIEKISIKKLDEIFKKEEYFIFPTEPPIKVLSSDIKALIEAYLKS